MEGESECGLHHMLFNLTDMGLISRVVFREKRYGKFFEKEIIS